MANVMFNDLSDEKKKQIKKEWEDQFKEEVYKSLMEAIKCGQNVIVGEYYKIGKEFIER